MPTEAQLNANRRNAQKSTGPTSPAGKARSSLNALKSGIDAWSHIIPGEDPAELEALTAAFMLHFRPADPVQLSLVDTLISTEWIQRRLRRIEAQLWTYQIECLDKNLTQADFLDASIQHNSPLGHAFQDALDPFTRIQRRIDSTNRMYLRTLKALQDLQSAEQPDTPVFEPPSPVPAQPLAPPIGFVPTNAPTSAEPPHVSREAPRTILETKKLVLPHPRSSAANFASFSNLSADENLSDEVLGIEANGDPYSALSKQRIENAVTVSVASHPSFRRFVGRLFQAFFAKDILAAAVPSDAGSAQARC